MLYAQVGELVPTGLHLIKFGLQGLETSFAFVCNASQLYVVDMHGQDEDQSSALLLCLQLWVAMALLQTYGKEHTLKG